MRVSKSIKKFVFIIFLFIITLTTVDAAEKKDILDIETSGNLTGILYSDNKALIYGVDNNNNNIDITVENVKRMFVYEGQYAYLTQDNRLYFNNEVYEDVIDFILCNNPDNVSYIVYLKTDGTLYERDLDFSNGTNYVYGGENVLDSNISEILFDNSLKVLFYKNKSNELYWYYDDYTNDKVLDNVKTFDPSYVLTNTGNLYFMNYDYDRGTYVTNSIATNVSKVTLSHWMFGEGNTKLIFYDKLNGKHYYSVPSSALDGVEKNETEVNFKVKKAANQYILSEDNKVYSLIDYEKDEIDIIPKFLESGVIDIQDPGPLDFDIYMLMENHDLYYYGVLQQSNTDFLTFITNKRLTGKVKLFSNIKSIEHLVKDNEWDSSKFPYIMITDDNRVLRYSYNDKNQFRDPSIEATFIPSEVIDLNTDKSNISVHQILLSIGNNKNITVGTRFSNPVIVLPFNATNKDVTITSSDSSVLRINNDNSLEALKVGKTNVCASLNSNSSIKTCEEINVWSNPTGISFGNEKSYYVKKIDENSYEGVRLGVEVLPNNELKSQISWSCDSDNCIIRESGLPDGVVEVSILEAGTYHVTASIEGVSDTFTITTVDKVTDVNVYLDDELYTNEKTVYLSDKNSLSLELTELPTAATINSYSVTSSNESIATIDEENGLIHLNGAGDVTININVNNTVNKNIVLHVLDVKKGDMDKSGTIEIFDVMELLYIVSGKKEQTEEALKIGDMTNDGIIDIFDVMELLYVYTGKK